MRSGFCRITPGNGEASSRGLLGERVKVKGVNRVDDWEEIQLEDKLLLISIRFTPKTKQSGCLKKWYFAICFATK